MSRRALAANSAHIRPKSFSLAAFSKSSVYSQNPGHHRIARIGHHERSGNAGRGENSMPKNLSCIAVAVLAGGLWFVGPSTPSVQAQTITFGPNGVQVGPNAPPDAGPRRDDHRDHQDHRDHGDRYRRDHGDRGYGDYHNDDRWREVRHRMREYREECQDGDRGSCVRLGIILGQNQARSDDWRREHPSYYWWDRD